jgi:hypothetical protein
VATVSVRALTGASFGSLAVGETKFQRIRPKRFSPLTEMMVSTTWLRGDVAARMPANFRETRHTRFLADRLSGIRARDASAHGFTRLTLLEHLALDGEGHRVEVVYAQQGFRA